MVPYKPIEKSRLLELEASVAAANKTMSEYRAVSSAGSVRDFFCEFVRRYNEGSEVSLFGVVVPADRAAMIIVTKEVESEIIAGFSPMIQKLVRRFALNMGVDPEDFFGEAFKSFLDALVNYDGSARFSTFLHRCLARHLQRVSMAGGGTKVPYEIQRLTMRVVDRMSRDRVSFDEAVDSEGVTPKRLKKVVAAMSKVCTVSALDIKDSEIKGRPERPSYTGVRGAIESANLGRLEKAVVEAFMASPTGEMGLSRGCAGMINPDTGRPYSRAAISSAWKQARKKLGPLLKAVA